MERDELQRSVTSEAAPPESPRIYVASLADYNDGRLHGRWIDAAQSVEALDEEVLAMLAGSPMPNAEEYAIHDFEGFGPWRLSEYESLAAVARVASGIAEHGEAFAHWVAYVGSVSEDDLARFEDAYLGTWPSVKDYAESLVDEFGVEDTLDRAAIPLRNYVRVDVDLLTRDIEIENHVSEGSGGVHIFGN